jgi:hypothetical protein
MDECAICLAHLRRTRSSRELSCGHVFHSKCIDKWKKASANASADSTCPLCRKKFDVPKFKVMVSIENTESNVTETTQLLDYSNLFINMFAITTELHFNVENDDELESILSDIGLVR